MNLKEINSWWEKGIDKERARFSNAPKSPKGQPFFVPEVSESFVSLPGRAIKSKPHAHQHKRS